MRSSCQSNGVANGDESTGKKARTQGEAFKRVKDDEWVGGLKNGFDDNTYEVSDRSIDRPIHPVEVDEPLIRGM